MMYKAMTQTVLLYSSKSWVVIELILKILEGFRHREDRQIAGMTVKRVSDGVW